MRSTIVHLVAGPTFSISDLLTVYNIAAFIGKYRQTVLYTVRKCCTNNFPLASKRLIVKREMRY